MHTFVDTHTPEEQDEEKKDEEDKEAKHSTPKRSYVWMQAQLKALKQKINQSSMSSKTIEQLAKLLHFEHLPAQHLRQLQYLSRLNPNLLTLLTANSQSKGGKEESPVAKVGSDVRSQLEALLREQRKHREEQESRAEEEHLAQVREQEKNQLQQMQLKTLISQQQEILSQQQETAMAALRGAGG